MRKLLGIFIILGILVFGLIQMHKASVYSGADNVIVNPLDPFGEDTLFKIQPGFIDKTGLPHPDGNPWGHCDNWPTVWCENMRAI
jgi:hypothetical protein